MSYRHEWEDINDKIIYNSRNYKCLIDFMTKYFFLIIYNSRNYKRLIDEKD